jgi:hypothetical protein
MAEFTERWRVTKTLEFALRNPSNIAEVGKAHAVMSQQAAQHKFSADDVQIRTTDEEIILTVQVSESVYPSEPKLAVTRSGGEYTPTRVGFPGEAVPNGR